MKNEKLILEYLDIKYGDYEVHNSKNHITILGIGQYGKSSNILEFSDLVLLDLVDWFGEGWYYPELIKWFCEKCEMTNDVIVMMKLNY